MHPRRLHEAAPALREEHRAGGNLDDAADPHVAHPHAVGERRGGDRHAARLEARQGGARSVDGVDDEHLLGSFGCHEAAVLRVVGDRRRALGEEGLERPLCALVDRKRDVPARRSRPVRKLATGVGAVHRERGGTELERELADQLRAQGRRISHLGRQRAAGRLARSAADRDRHRPPALAAQELYAHVVARSALHDQVADVARRGDRVPVDRQDHVAVRRDAGNALEGDLAGPGADAGVLGRPTRLDLRHQRSARHRQPEATCKLWEEILGGDAEVGVRDRVRRAELGTVLESLQQRRSP